MMMSTRASAALALAVLAFGQSPTVFAAGSCVVTALDSVAGLGTQISITGCAAGTSTTLSVRSPATSVYTQTISLDGSGNATTLIPSRNAETAGLYQVTVAGVSTTFTIIADRADDAHSSLTVSPTVVPAGGSVTVTAILRDKFDNPVVGRPIALVTNRPTDDVTAKSAQSDEEGRFLWTVKALQGGPMTLIPYDILSGRQLKVAAQATVMGSMNTSLLGSVLTGTEQGGDITADINATIIDAFELSLPQNATSVKANELFSMTIRAMHNDVVERSYIGTLIVESSDPDAELPKKGEDPNSPKTGRIDVRSVDQGQRNVPLSFLLRARGPQTVSVYDKNDPTVKGSITINVLRGGEGGSDSITILDPKDRSKIKGHSILLQGRAPSLVNLKVKGGANVVDAESDEEGIFRVNVDLNPNDREATLFVTSESNSYESQPIHVIVDNEPPVIGTISFDPLEGKTGDQTTITVKSESGLPTVTATLEGKTVTLNGAEELYSGSLTAPENPGMYDVTVVATDEVGNSTTMLAKWQVKPKLVPVVLNVLAESQPRQVFLKWQPVDGVPIREYKIYISKNEDPLNTLYSITTRKPVSSAIVKDLPIGIVYQFALTAINADGEESPEKSIPAAASPLGLVLKVTPGQDSLMLEWNKIAELPMSKYVLEFRASGTTEYQKIDIEGAAVTHVIKDLINDISYDVRLTPVSVAGKVMTDLIVTGSGTPKGSGFVADIADPVPPDLLPDTSQLHTSADILPDEVPETPSSGLSSLLIGLLFTLAVVLGLFYRSVMRQRRLTQEFLALMQERYHSS